MDLNFGSNEEQIQEPIINENIVTDNVLSDVPSNEVPLAEPEPSPSIEIPTNHANGLSKEELNDTNKITVTIADKQTPILILFGPPACGKTMTLVRLTRFLQREGYTVSPVNSFRPDYDDNYKDMCNGFDEMINSTNAATTTGKISFMLVRVMKAGRTLCQILEAPGEFYFDPRNPNVPFPNYVNTIINGSNRKIWAFMVEPSWKNQTDRMNYVTRIHKLKTKLRSRDKAIFVMNKIDLTPFVISPGQINVGQAKKEVMDLYPGIFEPFRNQNPITKWLFEYNFDFAPFQTGDYSKAADGTLSYQEGPDEYPRIIWRKILKLIRG